MIDPQIQAMFQAMVMPTIKQMPTDALRELQDYVNKQVDDELSKRRAIQTD